MDVVVGRRIVGWGLVALSVALSTLLLRLHPAGLAGLGTAIVVLITLAVSPFALVTSAHASRVAAWAALGMAALLVGCCATRPGAPISSLGGPVVLCVNTAGIFALRAARSSSVAVVGVGLAAATVPASYALGIALWNVLLPFVSEPQPMDALIGPPGPWQGEGTLFYEGLLWAMGAVFTLVQTGAAVWFPVVQRGAAPDKSME